MKKLLFLLLVFALPLFALSQKPPANVKLFVDCNGWCDMSFIKTEMNYIDFVADRFNSNVFVMVTSQTTGSGGEEIRLYFTGQEEFKGMFDTLQFNRSSVGTDDEYRKQLVQYLKVGLTRYMAKTALATKLNIAVEGSAKEATNSTAKKDPWNSWVISLRLSGNYSKDDYSKNYSYNTTVEGSRTTEKLKVRNQVFYNNSLTEITVGQKRTYERSGRGLSSNVVKSINQHWSYGGEAEYTNSRFSNFESNIGVMPAFEYSFFPYRESVKKALTLYYEIGPHYAKYMDSSYYGTFSDNLLSHSLSLNFGFVQNWGNIYTNVSWEGFLNDFELEGKRIRGKDVRNFSVNGNLDLRIFKGLSLYAYFQYDITKGIYPNIRRADFDIDDILSNSRQYPTSNNFFTYFGISYRFGSIYNNVVNPRFSRKF
jgi:hypothetical protein